MLSSSLEQQLEGLELWVPSIRALYKRINLPNGGHYESFQRLDVLKLSLSLYIYIEHKEIGARLRMSKKQQSQAQMDP